MFTLRPMKKNEWSQVANLIYLSTNSWYEKNLNHSAFSGGPEVCELFCQVYEDLDPGCCLVAEHKNSGMIIGSCFYHPRETHVSLGIMNVHPNYFGDGVASLLLENIIGYAEVQGLPLRLVSSALNLDSYSLYTRHGFSPIATYQDMTLTVPKDGLELDPDDELPLGRVREADLEDVSGMGAVEFAVSGISRELDYCYFLENEASIWDTLIYENEDGEIDGFLISVNHPGSNMLGPGVARTGDQAAALIVAHLNRQRGNSPVFLVPADNAELVGRMYALGAKNCELHFSQVRGDAQPIDGIVMPTFMPETG